MSGFRSFSRAIALLVVTLTAAPLFADGATLFKTKCAPCHGEKGAGDTVMGRKLGVRALGSVDVQKQTDAVLTDIITKGKNKMPSFAGKVSDPDIKLLVAHIRSLAKK